MNIAIYGGSFDPPHKGHEKIVKKALKKLPIDKLFIIPAWQNPFKKNFFAPPKLRSKWLKKLWGNNEKIQICTYEIDQKNPTTSYESINYIYKKYPIKKCYLIIGADNLKDLEKWHEYGKLKKKVIFVITHRNGIKIPKNLKKLKINVNISSTDLRLNPQRKFISKKIFKSVSKFYKKEDYAKNFASHN